jgi:drug/metabolite transporter (DMT)-like permease
MALFFGAVLTGGVMAPVLLMFGLSGMPASGAPLLLNAEAVFTATLAWMVFRENVDRRIALGFVSIVAGAAVLSWPDQLRFSSLWPALAVIGACLAWGMDNNLTGKVSLADASWIAMVKGLVAGSVNLGLALAVGAAWPPLPSIGGALLVGWLAYGVSLSLFVRALRHLGTARTGAYFSVALFFGAMISIPLFGEAISDRLFIAGTLMAIGVWLHLTEHHEHHQHAHAGPVSSGRHSHKHRHESLTHTHPHFPDAHHRHEH